MKPGREGHIPHPKKKKKSPFLAFLPHPGVGLNLRRVREEQETQSMERK